jgi:hypothetical protein
LVRVGGVRRLEERDPFNPLDRDLDAFSPRLLVPAIESLL